MWLQNNQNLKQFPGLTSFCFVAKVSREKGFDSHVNVHISKKYQQVMMILVYVTPRILQAPRYSVGKQLQL